MTPEVMDRGERKLVLVSISQLLVPHHELVLIVDLRVCTANSRKRAPLLRGLTETTSAANLVRDMEQQTVLQRVLRRTLR